MRNNKTIAAALAAFLACSSAALAQTLDRTKVPPAGKPPGGKPTKPPGEIGPTPPAAQP